jgi:probable phosphoglycerate mutase
VTSPGRRLLLLRHGRTVWNEERRFQGHSDVPLDAVGAEQAEQVAPLVAALQPAAVRSSDLVRAIDTAAPIGRLTGLPVVRDPLLRELSGGRWEGQTSHEIRAADPDDYRAWLAGDEIRAGGDGESRFDVGPRALPAVRAGLGPLGPGELLVVVTHGGTARALTGLLMGLPRPRWTSLAGLDNCRWTLLEEAGAAWSLREHNGGAVPVPAVAADR